MASIRRRKLTSGKLVWQVDYRDGGGSRRHRQFPTKRAADAFFAKTLGELSTGIHTPDSQSVTVSEASRLWLLECERAKLEESTQRYYRQHVDHHLIPFIGASKLSRLNAPALNALVDTLRSNGRSPEMVRRALSSLSRIFKFAVGRGLAAQNPAAAVRVTVSKRGKSPVPVPTKEELRSLIHFAEGRWRPLIVTALFTGLRASELRGLQWEDIDLQRRVVRVSRRADAWKKLAPPKSAAGVREVPLAPIVINVLREWRLVCPRGDLGLLFPTGAGQSLEHCWEGLEAAAGAGPWCCQVHVPFSPPCRCFSVHRAGLKPKENPGHHGSQQHPGDLRQVWPLV